MDDKEGFLLIGTAMVILLALVLCVFAVMFIYRKRRLAHEKEKQFINEVHAKQMLSAQVEMLQKELEKQKAIENVRSKISGDIHDEIGAGLTRISLLCQRLKLGFDNRKEIDPSLLEKVTESSKEVIGNLSEIIWTVNPKQDNLASMLSYLRNYTSHFFEDTEIKYTIDFPKEVPDLNIHPDVKRNLFLVIKESLNNIAKHAAATEVSIIFKHSGTQYAFTITDNGKGMDDINGREFGNGLLNMQNRMKAINGLFNIATEKNIGTTVALKGSLDY